MTDTSDSQASAMTVRVAVAVPLDRPFDYSPGGHGPLVRGSLVTVPFGPRQLPGIVLGPGEGDVKPESLKSVAEIVPLPPLEPNKY